MEHESDKFSILFRGDNSAFLQLYRLPSGVIRTGGFGNLDLDVAGAQILHDWLVMAINPDRPFTLQTAGGPTPAPGKGKGEGILGPAAAESARGGGA